MENEETPEYKTFGPLFEEIIWDYESKSPPYREVNGTSIAITFYKTTFFNDGTINRKGNTYKFDKALWFKIELMYKLLSDDPVLEVLYK